MSRTDHREDTSYADTPPGVERAVGHERRCCMDRGVGRETPTPICVHPTQTETRWARAAPPLSTG
jgi:hypothetical protein